MLQCVLYRTEESILAYVLINALQVTSWLEVSSVRVKVIMCHRLFDAHTEAHTFMGEGVDGIHKIRIIRRQSVCVRHAFKQWPRRIKTWKKPTVCNQGVDGINMVIIQNILL